jgi:phosphatidylglycerophosphatase A
MGLVARSVASVGGIGFVPRGPATVASLVGALVFMSLRPGLGIQILMLVAVVAIGQLWVAPRTRAANMRDPQFVVIDELAGVWLALLGLPLDVTHCVLGAAAFRVIDKLKPGPIRLIDQRGRPFALMGDDLAAGIVANLVLRAGMAVYVGLF